MRAVNVSPLSTSRDQPAPAQSPAIVPHNSDAEQALLAAILANPLAYEKVADFLKPDHFYNPALGSIFSAASTLIARGERPDAITLQQAFAADPALQALGGTNYLASLTGTYVSVANAGDYGRLIHDLYLRRELIGIASEVLVSARQDAIEHTAEDLVEEAETKLYAITTADATSRGPVRFAEPLRRAQETAYAAARSDSASVGVTTGFTDLDKKLGRLQPSDLVILAGRPAMGKTSLATNIATNAAAAWRDSEAREGAVTALFSLEMSAEQLATRMMGEHARIPSNVIRLGQMRDAQFASLDESVRALETLPLYIDDTAALTVAGLRTRARRLKRHPQGLGLIVVDYLQLMEPTTTRRDESRVNEISQITRGLKAVAKDLNVPILALSQLSRGVESREDKRPHLADLRDSGAIEQDADIVMFIYREDYYHERTEPARRAEESDERFNSRYADWQDRADKIRNVAEVIIAKHRHGPVGTVQLHFDGDLTRFSDLEEGR